MRRFLQTLALASTVLLGLAGCSPGEEPAVTPADPDADPAAVVAAAADVVEDVGSARLTMTMEMTMPGVGPMTTTAEGLFAFADQRGQMTMDMGQMFGTAPEMAPADTTAEMIMDGEVLYMRMPMLTDMMPGAGPWIRMDLNDLAEDAGMDFNQLLQMQQNDPTQALNILRAVTDVEEVGPDTVRDVETTHYRAEPTVEEIQAELPPEVADQLAQMYAEMGVDRIPIEVWIDDEGLVRRMVQDMTVTEPETGEGFGMRVTVELYDYGVPVEVSPPPEEEVTDFRELMQQGM